MQSRPWWTEVADDDNNRAVNFLWKPTSDGLNFSKLVTNQWSRCYNHFEFHSIISLKDELYKTVTAYCQVLANQQAAKVDASSFLPPTICCNFRNPDLQDKLESLVLTFKSLAQAAERAPNLPPIDPQRSSLQADSVLAELGIEDILRRSSHASYLALNTLLSDTSSERRLLKIPPSFDRGQNLWILKPNDFCRGCGLEVVSDLQTLSTTIKQFYTGFHIKDFDRFQVTQSSEDDPHSDKTDSLTRPPTEKRDLQSGSLKSDLPSLKNPLRAPIVLKTLDITFPANFPASKPIGRLQKMQQMQQQMHEQLEAKSRGKVIHYPNNTYSSLTQGRRAQVLQLRRAEVPGGAAAVPKPQVRHPRAGLPEPQARPPHLPVDASEGREYLVRLSSEKFSMDTNNCFVHLTNNAVQQYSNSYGKYEPGNMITFKSLLVAASDPGVHPKRNQTRRRPRSDPPADPIHRRHCLQKR